MWSILEIKVISKFNKVEWTEIGWLDSRKNFKPQVELHIIILTARRIKWHSEDSVIIIRMEENKVNKMRQIHVENSVENYQSKTEKKTFLLVILSKKICHIAFTVFWSEMSVFNILIFLFKN